MVLKEPKTRHSVRSLSLPEQCLVLLRQHKRNQIAERAHRLAICVRQNRNR
jgi:hypothetical protein